MWVLFFLWPVIVFGKGVALTEGDPSSYVHDVSVITGQLFLPRVDAVVSGATPLPIWRNYLSSSGWHYSKNGAGDLFLDGQSLFLELDPTKNIVVELTRTGNNEYSLLALPQGYTNTSEGEVGAHFHWKNIVGRWGSTRKTFEITFPDGTRRVFQHSSSEGRKIHYVPVKEFHSDGSVTLYVYNGKKLEEVKKTNLQGTVVFASYKILGNQIETSDGQVIEYEENRVTTPAIVEEYQYENGLKVVLPEERFLEYVFSPNGKVEKILTPLGELCTFVYHFGFTEVYDAAGNKTTYRYNTDLRLESIERLGSKEIFTWDKQGNLLSHALLYEDGAPFLTKTFVYDSFGNVVQETINGFSKFFTYSQDLRHLLLKEEDERGKVILYTYHPTYALLTSKTFVDLKTVFYEYDENFLLIKEGDKRFSRDKIGRISSITEEERKTVFTYSAKGKIEKTEVFDMREELLYIQETTYDKAGRVIREVSPLGNLTFTSYDENGNIILQESLDGEIRFSYDLCNRLIGRGKETWEYNNLGQVTRATDAETTPTFFTYDPLGNLIETSGKGIMKATYDPFGRQTSLTDARGNTTYTEIDPLGNPTRILHPDGTEETFTYTSDGKLTSSTNTEGMTTSYTYDVWGRELSNRYTYAGEFLIKRTDEEGHSIEYTYDSFGRKKTETMGEETKEFFYDALGRVSAIRNNTVWMFFERDVENNLVRERTKEGKRSFEVDYTYDHAGRVLSKTTNGTEFYAYDGLGRLTSYVNPFGGKTTISYEPFKKTTTHPEGGVTVETYDIYGNCTKIEKPLSIEERVYDPCGNLVKQISGDTCIAREYDARNREISVTDKDRKTLFARNIKTKPDGTRIRSQYDSLGRLILLESLDSNYAYTYDKVGNLLEVKDLNTDLSTKRTWDQSGRLLEEYFPQGFAMKYQYNSSGKRSSVEFPDHSVVRYNDEEVSYFTAEGVSLYKKTVLSYDKMGNVAEESLPFQLGNVRYTYDPTGRLSSIQSPFEIFQVQKQDLEGNIQGVFCLQGKQAQYKEYAYDAHSRLTSEPELPKIPLVYDTNGNLIQKGSLYLTYDSLDRLIEVKNGEKVIAYTYDGLHRRTSKTENGVTTYFLYDGNKEIGLLSLNKQILELRILSKSTSAERGAGMAFHLYGKIYIPLYDLFGNVSALIDPVSRAAIAYADISPFGQTKLKLTTSNPWWYSSKRLDPETGFYFFGRRYYDPELREFITPDPLGYVDGLNLYTYADNNPLMYIDPYGLKIRWKKWLKVGGFIVGGVIATKIACIICPPVGVAIAGLLYNAVPNIPVIKPAANKIGEFFSGETPQEDHCTNGIVGYNPLSYVSDYSRTTDVYVNGMLTSENETRQSALTIGEYIRNQVHYFHNSTKGFMSDLFECIGNSFGAQTKTTREASLFIQNEVSSGRDVRLWAHSQGGIQADIIRRSLPTQVKNHVKILTYGSASLFHDPSLQITHVGNKKDPIFRFLSPFGKIRNPHIVTIPAVGSSWLNNHSIMGPAYSGDLRKRASDFYKEDHDQYYEHQLAVGE